MAQTDLNPEPIPTPFPLLVRRFRYQVMPVLTVLTALVVAGFLYVRNGGVYANVGEVNIVRSTVNAKIDGVLAAGDKSRRALRLHDTVNEGETVAWLDAGPIEAEIQRYSSELEQLEKQLAAVTGGVDPATRPAAPGSSSEVTALKIAIAAAEGKLKSLMEQKEHLAI